MESADKLRRCTLFFNFLVTAIVRSSPDITAKSRVLFNSERGYAISEL